MRLDTIGAVFFQAMPRTVLQLLSVPIPMLKHPSSSISLTVLHIGYPEMESIIATSDC